MRMDKIEQKIVTLCNNDYYQKKIILSQKENLLIEAPAGYGKTRVLILKCIFFLSNFDYNDYRRVLLITYTNNGISRLRKDLDQYLSLLKLSQNKTKFIKERIHILNFHSLAKRILSKYGYILHDNLRDIYEFNFFNTKYFGDDLFNKIEHFFKKHDFKNFNSIKNKVLEKLLLCCEKKELPFLGVLILLLELLKNKKIKYYYNKFYAGLFIDEFQDTNFLVNLLIEEINQGAKNRFLFGDSLQTIFEFSGSDPELIGNYKFRNPNNFIALKNSYRLKNEEIKKLEMNIRGYYRTGGYYYKNNLGIKIFDKVSDEAEYLSKESKNKFSQGESCTILIGNRREEISSFLNEGIFFNALFNDEGDSDNYFSFNLKVLKIFTEFIQKYPSQNNYLFFLKYFDQVYQRKGYLYEENYIHLLKTFITEYIMKEVYYLDRKDFFKEVIGKNDLVKFIEFIKNRIVITTIHKSKGLEWDNIFLANMNEGILNFGKTESVSKADLRLFYVAVTRSKKNTYFSYNLENNKNRSNFFDLPFIKIS